MRNVMREASLAKNGIWRCSQTDNTKDTTKLNDR